MADFKAIMAEIKQPLWDNWYIVSELGSGASGVVYRIEAKRENRTDVSALKVEPITLEDVLISDPDKRNSILEKKRQAAVNETSIMYKLKKCPYIVGYEDENIVKLQHTDGYVLLIRMEYLTCLQDLVKRGGFDVSESNVLKLAIEIGSGIEAAHNLGIIHRDVKPANFFVSEDGTYKLGDFNISKTSLAARSFAGTEGYIAPEIYRAKQSVDNSYTKQADIYSFGICLYQLMNDYCFPFEDNCLAEEAVDRRMNGEPLPLPRNASPDFARIILRACAFEPSARYQSMGEFLNDLRALKYSGSAAPKPVQPQPPQNVQPQSIPQNNSNAGAFAQTGYNPFAQNSAPQVQPSAPQPNAPQSAYYQGNPAAVPPKKKGSKAPVVIVVFIIFAIIGALIALIATGTLFGDDDDDGGGSSKKKKKDIPSEAQELDGHHYMYYSGEYTWREAEEFCLEKGGHLISVNSRDEQQLVEETAYDMDAFNIWLGGFCVQGEMDKWYWTDDSEFEFKDWLTVEKYDGTGLCYPSNAMGNCYYLCYEDTQYIDGAEGSWLDVPNDYFDGDEIGFICEWE